MAVSGAEECRARARRCRDHAAFALDPIIRQQLRDLAEHWESMANDIDNIARMRKAMTEDDVSGRG